jgi:hypothetical protein
LQTSTEWVNTWPSSSDLVQVAYRLKGTRCPLCQYEWSCAQDVRERRPITDDLGIGACYDCYKFIVEGKNANPMAKKHYSFCLSNDEDMSEQDKHFVGSIMVCMEDDGVLEEDECERLYEIYTKLGGD